MATSTQAVVYSQATGVGATVLVCVATLTTDGTNKGIALDYFVETSPGVPNRVSISREDFLAIRQLRGLATP